MTDIISLPPPQTDLDFPLMRAIKERRTKRKWQDAELSEQELSNILWVACGITYEATKNAKSRRAAPSACNSQEIQVYVVLRKGVFLYDETEHRLVKVMEDDIRQHMGTQKMMQNAPLGLIYVSDYRRITSPLFKDDARRWYTSFADTGFMSENVYLYCAAANLSTAVLGQVDREKLHGIMRLGEREKVMYSQVIGRTINYKL